MSDPQEGLRKAKRRGAGGALLAFALVFGVGGVVLVVLGVSSAGEAELIGRARRIEADRLGEVGAGDLVAVHGRLGAERSARLPGKGEAAIRGRLEIEARYEHRTRDKTETRTRSLFQQTVVAEGAWLEPVSGGAPRTAIDKGALERADVKIDETRETLHVERGGGLFASPKLRYGDVSVDAGHGDDLRGAYAVKHLLAPGAEVWLVAGVRGDGGARTLAAPDGHALTILREDPEQVVQSLSSRAAWMQPLGGALALLGLVLLLPGLFLLIRG